MALDEPSENDEVIKDNGVVTYLIDKMLLEKAKPISVDFIESETGSGFSISSSLPKGNKGAALAQAAPDQIKYRDFQFNLIQKEKRDEICQINDFVGCIAVDSGRRNCLRSGPGSVGGINTRAIDGCEGENGCIPQRKLWRLGRSRDEGAQHYTLDGGKTWTAAKTGGCMFSVDIVDTDTIWQSCLSGTSLTVDGGKNWKVIAKDVGGLASILAFADAKTGWVGSKDKFKVTTDGGATWNELTLPEGVQRCCCNFTPHSDRTGT